MSSSGKRQVEQGHSSAPAERQALAASRQALSDFPIGNYTLIPMEPSGTDRYSSQRGPRAGRCQGDDTWLRWRIRDAT
jgi:hypothetical protein